LLGRPFFLSLLGERDIKVLSIDWSGTFRHCNVRSWTAWLDVVADLEISFVD